MEKVLFVASECTPFIKTGGLADVIGSLPQALRENEAIDVSVILPLYREISAEWRDQMKYCASFEVTCGWRKQATTLYLLTYKQVDYYFIENNYYFGREGIYGYEDDGERFVYYSQAVIEAVNYLDFTPSILHAHDWQAAVTITLAKILQPVKNMHTIFTIHNMKYQGILQMDAFDDLFNVAREHIAGFEWNGALNCLKSALFHADKITTVSPTYAEEIKYPYFSEGLDPILQERSADLVGVLNGIDIAEYNPATDPHIAVNYETDRAKKMDNKEMIQKKLGLPQSREVPLYVIITRLVEQKGLHLVKHILDTFLQEDVQCIVLGTGDKDFEEYFTEIALKHPNKLVTLLTFSEPIARQLYASADFFIMPSKFEPCGLAQLIALQYKTVPIVRETGGLKDTVTPFNDVTGQGNGFSFTNYNAHDLLATLHHSFIIYHDTKRWPQLCENVNQSRFSWEDSARTYADLYESLQTKK